MKKLLIIFSVLFALLLREECHGQGTVKYTAGISYGYGDPTYTPNGNVSKKYINLTTLRSSTYSGTAWVLDGRGIDVVSGCAAPAYTPGLGQSNIVINNCTLFQNGQGPELYVFDGTSWIFINEKNTAPTYTAGTGIDITGTVISNTGDLSNTNEIQNLSLSGQTLGISSGNTVALPVVAVASGTGISVSNSSGTATVTNTAPDQVVSITGAGTNTVTGTYPNFTVTGTEVDGSVTNELQTLSVAGSNLSISGGNTVMIPTPSSTLDALTDVTITTPSNNQILQYNSAGSQWVNATLSAITGSVANYQVAYGGGGGGLTGVNSFVFDYITTRLGIGATSPQAVVDARANSGLLAFFGSTSGSTRFSVGHDGRVGMGLIGWIPTTSGGQSVTTGAGGCFIGYDATGDLGYKVTSVTLGRPNNRLLNATTGGQYMVDIVGNFSPTSGNAVFKPFNVITVINQTGGANGAIYGIDYNPTITNINGAHYAALFRSGQVSVGNGAPSLAAKLEVTSTTQGVLFPRMTSTQRDAIASPPDGLVVYNTTAAKLQVRAASAWVDLH